jgi:hypothetical protein
MTRITWAAPGQKKWKTGVDRGVLFLRDEGGVYDTGYAWPGLTNVTESPSGAESNKQYADNGVYANLKSAEEFGATIEAFNYPPEFERCDGTADLAPGVKAGQQARETFGFSYRVLLGDDLQGDQAGYEIHLIYGADAAPSEVSHATVNDSPELAAFSWEVTTTPVEATNLPRPTAHLTINSTEVDAGDLAALEDIIYGDAGNDPRLPLPDEVESLFGTVTVVNMNLQANQPSFVNATGVLTLPAVVGVQWKVDGVNKTAGAQPAISAGQEIDVDATPQAGYSLDGDTNWNYERV